MEKQQLTAAAVLAAPSEFHNQRLEFLGDAVLEFVSTHHIFCSFPSYWEGDLTDARSSMVNNKVLGCFALRLGFDALLLHADADKDGVRFKDDVDKYLKLLADAFEAFMGALYLDSGIGACRQLLAKCVYPKCSELPLRRYWLQAANEEYSPPDKTARPADGEGEAARARARARARPGCSRSSTLRRRAGSSFGTWGCCARRPRIPPTTWRPKADGSRPWTTTASRCTTSASSIWATRRCSSPRPSFYSTTSPSTRRGSSRCCAGRSSTTR